MKKQVAVTAPPSLIKKMAAAYGVDSEKLLTTLKDTAFRQQNGVEISNEQMMALLVVADQYGLNPFTKQIYAFPGKGGGIVPIIPIDGWLKLINEHSQFDGMAFSYEKGEDGNIEAVTCTIHRKDRDHPTVVTEYMSECYRATEPWKQSPIRMLRHKAVIQCGRYAFGLSGIVDEDEAQRIVNITADSSIEHDTPETKIMRQELQAAQETPVPLINDGGINLSFVLDSIDKSVGDDDLDACLDLVRSLSDQKDQAAAIKAIGNKRQSSNF